MSSLSPKDRVPLCLFTFTDGRRCLTPRTGNHPHFCFYHAQKEARSQTADKLAKDLACFFSGEYLSACDLSTALARLIPAVVRGDIKPKLARTIAYMFQTLTQSIHISQKEYANAYGTEGWRKAVRNSINSNYDYRFPPAHKPEPQQPPTSTQPPQTPAPFTSAVKLFMKKAASPKKSSKPTYTSSRRSRNVITESLARNLS